MNPSTLEERAAEEFIGHCPPAKQEPAYWGGTGSVLMHHANWCKNPPIEPLGLCVEHRIEILGRAD